MKKLTALLLCATILLCLCGCKEESPTLVAPVSFYYRIAEIAYDDTSVIIDSEQRESSGFNGNMQLLLNAYFNGPVSQDLKSPFPRSLKSISYSVFGATAIVQVSSVISQIKGVDLSIACACIANTIFDMNSNIEWVQISTTGPYLDGSKSITISRSSLLLSDTANDPLPAEPEATVISAQ